jgi:hypothetical protein
MTIGFSFNVQGFKPGSGQLEPVDLERRWRVRSDNELAEFGFTMRRGYGGRQTPAVFRFAEQPENKPGDHRVRVAAWEQFIRELNLWDKGKWSQLTGPATGLFNVTGWDKLQLLITSSNLLCGEPVGGFLRFTTLKLTELASAAGMTYASHPCKIQRVKMVGKRADGSVYLADTNQGPVDCPVITKSGVGYIALRYVEEVS